MVGAAQESRRTLFENAITSGLLVGGSVGVTLLSNPGGAQASGGATAGKYT
jgi:hypothetical protein